MGLLGGMVLGLARSRLTPAQAKRLEAELIDKAEAEMLAGGSKRPRLTCKTSGSAGASSSAETPVINVDSSAETPVIDWDVELGLVSPVAQQPQVEATNFADLLNQAFPEQNASAEQHASAEPTRAGPDDAATIPGIAAETTPTGEIAAETAPTGGIAAETTPKL